MSPRPYGLLASLFLVIPLIVDQIDGEVAAVELEDRSITHLPLTLLPSDVREGDRIELQVQRLTRRRSPRGRRAPRRALRLAPTSSGRIQPEGEPR